MGQALQDIAAITRNVKRRRDIEDSRCIGGASCAISDGNRIASMAESCTTYHNYGFILS